MAQLITPSPNGDSVKTVEDKTRDLVANQGVNNETMWALIDIEIASAVTAGTLLNTEYYAQPPVSNKHGNS